MPRTPLAALLLTGCAGETYDYIVKDVRLDGGWAVWKWEDEAEELFEVATNLPSQPTIGVQVSGAGKLVWGDKITLGLWRTQGDAQQASDGEVRAQDGDLSGDGLAEWSGEGKVALDGSFETTLPGEPFQLGALLLEPTDDLRVVGDPSEETLTLTVEFSIAKPTIKEMGEEAYWEAIAEQVGDQQSEDALGDALLGLLGNSLFGESAEEPDEDPSLILDIEAERCTIVE